jgi:catechol 2,3-dioxygenase-like lactoylglutathione lyase family enzyme
MVKVEGLDHVAITARDPRRSIRFYTEVLGLTPECEWPEQVTVLRAGTTRVAIAWSSAGKEPGEMPAIAIEHFAFRVDRESFERARAELGAYFDHESDHGIYRSLYLRDPDGHLVELACYEIAGTAAKMPRALG